MEKNGDITGMKKEKYNRKQTALLTVTGILLLIAYPLLVFFLGNCENYFIYLAAAVALYAAELTVTLAGRLSPFAFLPFDLAALVLSYGLLTAYCVADPYFSADEGLPVFVCLFCARALFVIVDLIRGKRAKFIPVSVLGAVLVFALSYCSSLIIFPAVFRSVQGEADKTSSWGQISEGLEKILGSERIVTDSSFRLDLNLDGENEEEYSGSYGTFPVMDGSTVCVPMALEFAIQHTGYGFDTVRSLADFSTTHYAYCNLINRYPAGGSLFNPAENVEFLMLDEKPVDIIFATEPSEEELQLAAMTGVELVAKPVCYDAFVFITHKNNPVDNLATEQIRDIYSGEIKNWKDVGGDDKKITAYQREANSGSQTAMENLLMGGRDMIDPKTAKVIEGMGMLVNEVAEYRNSTSAIGYTYKYYIDVLYKSDDIKILSVDGVYPSDENIRSGAYPYTTNYYGVIRGGDEQKTGGLFLDWVLSDEGQKCVELAGYIPMR